MDNLLRKESFTMSSGASSYSDEEDSFNGSDTEALDGDGTKKSKMNDDERIIRWYEIKSYEVTVVLYPAEYL